MTSRRRSLLMVVAAVVLATGLHAQQGPVGGVGSIQVPALKEWLGYLSSDELQGRQVYTEGLGLAASFIADRLQQWGVEPAGDDGGYFQTVRVLGVNNASRSTVTVEADGERRTFKDGEGVFLPPNMGGAQTVHIHEVVFAGYGLRVPAADIDDYADLDPTGKAVVWLGAAGPADAGGNIGRLLAGRSRLAIESGAAVAVSPAPPSRGAAPGAVSPAQEGRGSQPRAPAFTTAQRYDRPVPPTLAAQDEFLEFLFSRAPVSYAELKAMAEKQEALPRFPLEGVTLTVRIEPDYSVVSTRLSRNVVGIVRGDDPALEATYVTIGAHYDHIGYQQTAATGRGGGGSGAAFGCPGQVRPTPRPDDIIYNGADDDGSGTVALMAIARAFALGPRPRRSLLFIWHTGEESGLHGSRYNADFPVVPNEAVIAHLNMDMIGRNRCDDPDEANTVYLVGSDRISTELHNLSEDVNATKDRPLRLDYEMNDPGDPQSIYTRSDHYSYAAKGIPVIFYTTGLHADYHYVTDEIEKIEFEKLARIARLVYLTGERLANLDRPPARDNRGPRAGVGSAGRLER
jgi:hypothetical protein